MTSNKHLTAKTVLLQNLKQAGASKAKFFSRRPPRANINVDLSMAQLGITAQTIEGVDMIEMPDISEMIPALQEGIGGGLSDYPGLADGLNQAMQTQAMIEAATKTGVVGVDDVFYVAAAVASIVSVAYIAYEVLTEESPRDAAFRDTYSLDPDDDLDGDKVKNVNDADIDGDGVLNEVDKAPADPGASVVALDTDGDGIPDIHDSAPNDPSTQLLESALRASHLSAAFKGSLVRVAQGQDAQGHFVAAQIVFAEGGTSPVMCVNLTKA
ncbi:MAG: hypothetical protein AAGD04_13935 [Pseudomonadota bacterium]